MKIFFIGNDFGIYQSNAASNLIRNISRGIHNAGIETHLISLSIEYGNYKGEINGVKYYIAVKQLKRNKSLIIRLFHRYFKSRLNLFLYLRKHASSSNSVCIIYSEKISVYFLSYLIKPFFKTTLIYAVEHPFRENPPNSFQNLSPKVYRFLVSSIFDGAICISYYLKDYYSAFWKKNLVVIPSVVDPEQFQRKHVRKVENEYICYCGSITKLKDGVDILIKAFKEVSLEIQDIKLLLIGGFYPPDGTELEFKCLVEDLNLGNKVVFTGHVDYKDIPSYTLFARVLVFPRPLSLQAKAGFPTKLPEYLATGIPVVVSKVGDVTKYITEKEAYLVAPGNIHELKLKLIEALLDTKSSKNKGLAGQKISHTIFHFNSQGKILADFLQKNTNSI